MQVIVNAADSNRVLLLLGGLPGPLVSTALGAFNPGRDLELYIDGTANGVLSSTFDSLNNRYLIFISRAFDADASIVQLIHHMPLPPFTAGASVVPGFALIAGVGGVDAPIPTIGLSVPARIIQNQPVAFTWSVVGAAQIQITTTTGYNSGLFSVSSSAGVVYIAGFTSSGAYTATVAGFDASGTAIAVHGGTLTETIPLIVASALITE